MAEGELISTKNLEILLKKYFSKKDASILRLYFPATPKISTRYMYFLLSDVLEIHKDKSTTIGTVVFIYSAVGVLSIIFNLILLQILKEFQHYSSAALFLMVLMLLDMVSSLMILVELFLTCTNNLPTLDPHNTWTREFVENIRIGLQLTSLYLLFLVAVDRWFIYASGRGRLFKSQRLAKLVFSLTVPAAVTILTAHIRPPTITMEVKGTTFQIYPCVYFGCRGSVLHNHPWRKPNDIRETVDKVFAFGTFTIILLVFIPFYIVLLLILTKKINREQTFEKERIDIKNSGTDLIYFEHMKRNLKGRTRLPIIFEINETESNIEQGILFPYSINILHKETGACDKTPSDTFWYDKKPEPQNAPILEEVVIDDNLESDLDPLAKAKRKRKLLRSKNAALTLRHMPYYVKRKFSGTITTSPDFNANRYQARPCLARKSQLHEDKSTQTDKDTSLIWPEQMCESCSKKNKRGENESTGHFFTRQIVFSINCCCNKPSSIECINEIQYPSHGSVSKTHSGSGESRVVEKDCKKCDGDNEIKSLKLKGSYQENNVQAGDLPLGQAFISITNAQSTFETYPSTTWGSLYNQAVTNSHQSQFSQVTTDNFSTMQGSSVREEEFSLTDMQKSRCWAQQDSRNWNIRKGYKKHWDHSWNNVTDKEPTEEVKTKESKTTDVTISPDDLQINEYNIQESLLEELKAISEEETEDAFDLNSIVSGRAPGTLLTNLKTKSSEIHLQVQEHFARHSEPLPIIGIPPTLLEGFRSWQLEQAQYVVMRLATMTIVYSLIRFLPWWVEITSLDFSDTVALITSFSGLVQFVCLVSFSTTFRLHLQEFWKKLEAYG